ncbi:S53 family peptidase [Sulfuracidifex tepidarius]|uniref:Peptidase S53 domain-containing protein n=1 Tax=Sulfuracidifex tepidarius TaxID=1294262 RepID=A0A510DVN7_9CREN|nr:protease pro-enzyme activation domain-containing protein [Sulfuracidifex tepidarius]BBG24293.1 hypothetical protein IC006_1602 [Sulfuracidifex tepidarius]BBG27050.1 hypothetical protein IC007_1579 [Sulfuracidifex tepidarius]
MGKRSFLGIILMLVMIVPVLASYETTLGYSQQIPNTSLPSYNIPEVKGFVYEGTLNPHTSVVVTFQIPLRNLNLLYYYAEQTSDPGSTLYHHFLAKEQVRELFYPVHSYEKLLSWVKEEGLKVISSSTDSVIVVEGQAYQFQKIGLNFLVFSNGTESYYAASGNLNEPVRAFVYSSNLSNIFFQHPSTLFTHMNAKKENVNSTAPIEGYPIKSLWEAYNITPLFSNGIKGSSNFSIGILDFYGDPYIKQQLAFYDHAYNISSPPYFSIVPIGPYDPNLGISQGWAGEISLDVESAHTMAPGAGITLYIANGNLPLYSIISCIDQQDNVTDLSESFSIPEEDFSTFNGPEFYSCVVLTDEYYAMGTAEGITFLASSGDAGGSGYSAGPLGTVGYPSTSPWVLSMGGTTTYIDFGKGIVTTSWSNYGFIPDGINYGGSTGGVSIIEPKPWYQNVSTPSSYPQGREIPDLSANANAYPGVYIICPGNITEISGGTSEASPLMAGMIALLSQYVGGKLGDLNPVIYKLAENSSIYQKAFVPITFGYNIPWIAKYGYNLVNGWGSVNLGYLSQYLKQEHALPSLSVSISVLNGTPNVTLPSEVFLGEKLEVTANVTYNGTPVIGNVTLLVKDVMGTVEALKMQRENDMYVTSFKLPSNDSGITSLTVVAKGEVNGSNLTGVGMVETFAGYYICFQSPQPMTPYYTEDNVTVVANVEGIYGQPFNESQVEVNVFYYNFTSNEYELEGSLNLTFDNSTGEWVGYLAGNYSPGVILLMGENAYGFVSFYNGFDLQSIFVLPQVVSEPGSVSGGQYIMVFGTITPPSNLPNSVYSDSVSGTTINVTLLSPNNTEISESSLYYNSSTQEYEGDLYVPPTVHQGLYDVIFNAQYQSYSLDQNITGYFYGQVYVTPQGSIPRINVSEYSLQGSIMKIYANISYPNGTPVEYGMYSATIFPYKLSAEYPEISNVLEIPLFFNYSTGLWEGNVTLPSIYNDGNLTYLGSGISQGPFYILITGESYNGVPTGVELKYAKSFTIEPYSLVENQNVTLPLPYTFFVGDTIQGFHGTLMNDMFQNTSIVGGKPTLILSSGSVSVSGTNLTIANSNMEEVEAYDSNITILDSHISNLVLVNSRVIILNSNVTNVSPTPVRIEAPAELTVNGTFTLNFTVLGESVNHVTAYLNGTEVETYYKNGTLELTLNTSQLKEGAYQLLIKAVQNDGVSASHKTIINVNTELSEVSSSLSKAESNLTTIKDNVSSINSSVSIEKSNELQTRIYSEIAIAVGIISLIIAIIALIRRRK